LIWMTLVGTMYPLWAIPCSDSQLTSEKEISKTYTIARGSSCRFSASAYLSAGKSSLLAHRPTEALWFAQMAEKGKLPSGQLPDLFLLEGDSLLELGRYEEAIIALQHKFPSSATPEYQQKAHLLLIKTYYLKAGKTRDKNVLYLLSTYNKKYPESRFSDLLQSWLEQS